MVLYHAIHNRDTTYQQMWWGYQYVTCLLLAYYLQYLPIDKEGLAALEQTKIGSVK
jgi:hypothetical protein